MKLSPAQVAVLERAAAGRCADFASYSVVRSLYRRGLLIFGKARGVGYRMALTDAGRALVDELRAGD